MGLIDESKFNFLWVTDWPLLEYDEETRPFLCCPPSIYNACTRRCPLLETEPEKVRAQAYDIVLNGYELGGGSLRIFERDVQEKMFKALRFYRGRSK